MVGVPRSKGCSTCIRRRTKCDEARPACGNCVKYGVECPGYDRSLKFVAGKHTVRSRGKRQTRTGTSSPDSVHARRPQPGFGSPDKALSDTEEKVVEELVTHRGIVTSKQRLFRILGQSQSITTTPRTPMTQFISALFENVQNVQHQNDTVAFGPWFDSMVYRVGKKQLFDMSICSFALHLLGKANSDENLISQSRTLYGQSLGALQGALDHTKHWNTAETLGSAVLLCYYELFSGTTRSDVWMVHAAGIGRLIQLRGPKAHESDWERSILLSFRSIIIMNDLFSTRDCFLAEPQWQAIMVHNSASTTVASSFGNDMTFLFDRYLQLLAKVPSILRYGYHLRELNARGEPLDIPMAMRLSRAAEKVHQEFLTFYSEGLANKLEPMEVPTEDPGSIFPMVLKFENTWVGSLFMGYWASVLILQECLQQTHYRVDFTKSNQLYTENILRSVETVGDGLMGPLRCGYGIRIAYEFADPDTQGWIRMWLGRFEKIYAATSATTYPKTKAA
ncbi:hypothetical protein BX600DRAFT_509065 [Xylariales sp. PMI_506]|nr:hypothetical protein BX600DRAFT_509065 [Xylariales sp. PMI_506]